ncbi:MAG TPA: ATP synthase F1 subunit epsilon [Saprospiraceae bacterium]|nr:ATP synthase F1 subunit epsilon [Saprospiraceae bacterium]HPG09036.1 ATP synthase F1 subunit epsilon [Saprospiraceae bacterium]HQU41070.1 ATP synthase F1 subunit epsilon [Chitinophagales bacterium]HRV85725.1 ATP synthase F1 subunit epsilon [Saprospiraceae bacterium]
MELIVLTPQMEVFRGHIKSVKVPGTAGQFEVLAGHAPIVSSLQQGKVRIITESGEKKVFSILNGFIEVLNNEVSLLVQGVDLAPES